MPERNCDKNGIVVSRRSEWCRKKTYTSNNGQIELALNDRNVTLGHVSNQALVGCFDSQKSKYTNNLCTYVSAFEYVIIFALFFRMKLEPIENQSTNWHSDVRCHHFFTHGSPFWRPWRISFAQALIAEIMPAFQSTWIDRRDFFFRFPWIHHYDG